MVILTVKRPLGRPRRSTGADRPAPLTTFALLPLTSTVAFARAVPAGLCSRILNMRRLTQLCAEGREMTSAATRAGGVAAGVAAGAVVTAAAAAGVDVAAGVVAVGVVSVGGATTGAAFGVIALESAGVDPFPLLAVT